VLDRQGKKMSKSKGTGVDPIPMMEKYGTDAIRLSLVLGTTAGQDFRLFEEKIAGYRNFVNKLWNVSRFILSQDKTTQKPEINTLADKWIVSQLQNLIGKTTDDIEDFQFSEAGIRIYEFLWHEFADWYVEVSKIEKNTSVLYYILENILKLSHPFAPFVTEEIWSRWHGETKSKMLMIQEWPSANKKLINEQAEKDFELIKKFIVLLRNFRAEHNISPKTSPIIWYWGKNEEVIKRNSKIISQLAHLKVLENIKGKSVSGSFSGLDYYLHYEPEKSAIEKEEKKISIYIQKIEAKLSNKNFLSKAPKEVVEKEKQKLKEQQDKLKRLV